MGLVGLLVAIAPPQAATWPAPPRTPGSGSLFQLVVFVLVEPQQVGLVTPTLAAVGLLLCLASLRA